MADFGDQDVRLARDLMLGAVVLESIELAAATVGIDRGTRLQADRVDLGSACPGVQFQLA